MHAMVGFLESFVKRVISTVVDGHYPSKANHEVMSLHDPIAFAVMAHIVLDGMYRKAYRLFMDELRLFLNVRYNKVVERLNRYEGLLIECLRLFKLEGEVILVDTKPIATKKLVRFGRYRKRGKSSIIKEEESIGYNPLKGGST